MKEFAAFFTPQVFYQLAEIVQKLDIFAAPSVPAAATFASDTKVTRYCPGASVTPVVPEAVMLPVELMEFAGSVSVPPAAIVCASVL